MSDDDLLSEAMAELYSAGLDEFTERRGDLAARARAGGQSAVAKQIAGLRKPTRSAWVVNQLVRGEPDVAVRLAALGTDLRAAESSMDGARIRELSLARRQLIEALVRQAFAMSGQPAPPAGLREEVTATLTAALADPGVAEQLRAGTLLRAARWDGFGSAAASTLTPVAVPAEGPRPAAVRSAPAPASPAPASPAPASPAPASPAPARSARDGSARDGSAPDGQDAQRGPDAQRGQDAQRGPGSQRAPSPAATAAERAAARAAAIQAAERDRRLAAIAAAERALAEADRAAEAAATAELEQEDAVQLLEDEVAGARRRLADASRRLSDASREARRTRSAQREARQALDRLAGSAPRE